MYQEAIRIGTLANGKNNWTGDYLRQILPYGFESFSITFWQTLRGTDLKCLSDEIKDVITDKGAVVSSLGVFGNPLMDDAMAEETREGWRQAIDNAHLFGCDIVSGFAGRIVDKPIDESIPRFAEVFGPLAKRAADKGVRIAFENCHMNNTWWTGGWNIAINPSAWEMMFNAIPSENVGLEWEPCHQMVSLIDPLPQLRKWAKKVFHVHGKDATVLWDVVREYGVDGPEQFTSHRTPGFGDTNWTDLISILRQNDFKGSIDIEGWHDPVYRDELEMMGQVTALNYLKRCRGGDFHPDPQFEAKSK